MIAAFAELVSRCTALIEEMKSRRVLIATVSPRVMGIADEIQMITMQVRNLAEELADAERAERGLGDFLKTDFWYHRWELFEIWILVSLVRVLQAEGGQLRLHDVKSGVWSLSLLQGQPAFRNRGVSARPLEVYYQLFRTGAEGNALTPKTWRSSRSHGRAFIVVDPKHGKTYGRTKVQRTLGRYARVLPEADLTAIVNYPPMPSYEFDDAHRGLEGASLRIRYPAGSLTILRRFELACSDARLLGRGYHQGALSQNPIQHSPRPAPAGRRACVLGGQLARR